MKELRALLLELLEYCVAVEKVLLPHFSANKQVVHWSNVDDIIVYDEIGITKASNNMSRRYCC
jgi:hypothetical protein